MRRTLTPTPARARAAVSKLTPEERRQAAYHEAGHAVYAVANRVPVRGVHVGYTDVRSPGEMLVELRTGDGEIRTDPRLWIPRALRQRVSGGKAKPLEVAGADATDPRAETPHGRYLWLYVPLCLAGPAAEAEYVNQKGERGERVWEQLIAGPDGHPDLPTDWHQAMAVARPVYGIGTALNDYLRRVRGELETETKARWAQITVVAEALLERGALSGRDVRAMLRAV